MTMEHRAAIGVILPSSNRIVERVTRSILENYPGVDACFTRVPYAGHPSDGYNLEPFRRAASMLAEAHPEIILWNATRGALLGFEPDRQLCAMIESETGIPATTTALATVTQLRAKDVRRIALLAQGTERDGAKLVQTFRAEGIEIVSSASLGIVDNYEAARVSAADIEHAAAQIVRKGEPDALLVWSTNLAGYPLIDRLSLQLGVRVVDSTAIGTFEALARVAQREPAAALAQQ